jgi:hypothetical protein
MKFSKGEFAPFIKMCGEVCGKVMTDGSISFYWHNLHHIESDELRRSFSIFTAKGKWPTVNDILEECGYSPHQTRKEKYSSSRDDTPESEQIPERNPTDVDGEYTWESRVECVSLSQAEPEFSKCKANLMSNGWAICNENTFECRSQATPKSPIKTVWKRHWHAVKVPKDGKPVWGNR